MAIGYWLLAIGYWLLAKINIFYCHSECSKRNEESHIPIRFFTIVQNDKIFNHLILGDTNENYMNQALLLFSIEVAASFKSCTNINSSKSSKDLT